MPFFHSRIIFIIITGINEGEPTLVLTNQLMEVKTEGTERVGLEHPD